MINEHGGDIYKHKNVIDFSANINPLGLPRGVKIALMDCIDKTVHYPDINCEALREKLAFKYSIKKDYLICGNGAADLIFAISVALKPRKALILAPTFVEYEQSLRAGGSKIFYYNLKEDQHFQLNKNFLNCITSDYDMIFLCNPNNPTGEIIQKPLLMQIIEKCHKHNIILIVDECFNSFLENPEAESVMKEVANYDNLIVLNAFTKLYAMPGIRLGFGAMSNMRIRELIEKSTQPWNVSVLAQEAGLAALEETEYVTKTMELITQEREFLITQLKQSGYQVYGSKANYIFFRGEKGLFEKCLLNQILIRDCSNYRGLEEGYYRIAVKTHEENEKFLESLHS